MTLYLVGTPIGNLGDITFRAVEILRTVGAVFAEDTRVSGGLLAHLGLEKPLFRADEEALSRGMDKLLDILEEKGEVAFVTDAGTPGVSDPGYRIVEAALRRFGDDVKIEAIPGPSALTTALSLAHFSTSPFTFYGFPPHKKGRKTFFEEIAAAKQAVVLYESVHRVEKAMKTLVELMPERDCMVVRELTKLYEEVFRGTVAEVAGKMQSATLKGEFVIILAPQV